MNTKQGTEKNIIEAGANSCVESCRNLAAQLERAKSNLLAELRETLDVPERLFQLAVGEAEALAWQTGYPQLLFPALAMEKLQAVSGWNARQQLIRGQILLG